jgi:Putative beta-barrel porin 2
LVNPSNQYVGTFSVDKIFNRGILSLSSSVARTDFENQNAQSSQSYRSRTFTENAGVWLGPLFYAYSNGSIGTVVTDATSVSTTSYRLIGGLGTRQFSLFRGSLYYGHQGTEGSAKAGGDVYGGALSYYPTSKLTLTGAVDRTTNIASQASAVNLALTLPTITPLQIAVGTSSRTTSASLQSNYEITPQWFTNWQLGYTRVEYIGSSRLDNAWVLNATLRYEVWRNLSLTWEYRYKNILSSVPLASAINNTGTMGATYKF